MIVVNAAGPATGPDHDVRDAGDGMDDDNDNEEGFGAIFWLMLGLALVGVVGFVIVAAGAMGGA